MYKRLKSKTFMTLRGGGGGQQKVVYKTNDTNDWAKSTVSKKKKVSLQRKRNLFIKNSIVI